MKIVKFSYPLFFKKRGGEIDILSKTGGESRIKKKSSF